MASHCESSPVHLMGADSAPRWPPTLRPSQPTWTMSPPKKPCFCVHEDLGRAVCASEQRCSWLMGKRHRCRSASCSMLYSDFDQVNCTSKYCLHCAKQQNKVDVLHVRLTDLHAAHQNLPFPPNRTLPLKQYQYQGRL